MRFLNRRTFLESLLAAFGLGAGVGAVTVQAAAAPPAVPAAKPVAGIDTGVLVVEFDAAMFPHRDDGVYHGGVVGAVSRIAKGRKLFEVGGQQIFPVYSPNGSPTRMATIILIPDGSRKTDLGYFGDAPKVRWLGGDKFERVA